MDRHEMGSGTRRSLRWAILVAAILAPMVAVFSEAVVAHASALRGSTRSVTVPTWLFLSTGGGAVGASFLLASFVTDRSFIRSIHDWAVALPAPGRLLRAFGRVAGVAVLAVTVAVGYLGPTDGYRNLAVLIVWVLWWGGYVASTYLVGNSWPTLNPFRTLASLVPSRNYPYPDRLASWPSVVGLLGLIWLEVVSPLADDPRLLATTVVAYTAVSIIGSAVFGSAVWFERVDPISMAFRLYGRVAPIARTDGRLTLRLPGTALSDADVVSGPDETAFVVALLYVTTFDGFVATGSWRAIATAVVGAGVPPLAVYLFGYLVGFALFLGAFWWSMRIARRFGKTYITRQALAARFSPSLLAIAAGYQIAHNLAFVAGLLPAIVTVGSAPFAPPSQLPVVTTLPGWVSGLELALVLLGHVLAVWVAHAAAYDLLPGRLEAIKSQYGITVVMVGYTMISLWIVTTPTVAPPFLGGGG
jgi:hypothetical protein